MTETIHGKLVRDKIPEIIESHGERVVSRVLSTDEYRRELLKKLVEEATELLESDGSIEERADVAEVLLAIDRELAIDADQLEQVRQEKALARGAFKSAIFLEKSISDDYDTWENEGGIVLGTAQ